MTQGEPTRRAHDLDLLYPTGDMSLWVVSVQSWLTIRAPTLWAAHQEGGPGVLYTPDVGARLLHEVPPVVLGGAPGALLLQNQA